ncbi:MAG: hypothetical protein M5U19_11835 [Microthrixaceae bacterium]|nr:hypothetical protein [Microthrixaceae bacterium]
MPDLSVVVVRAFVVVFGGPVVLVVLMIPVLATGLWAGRHAAVSVVIAMVAVMIRSVLVRMCSHPGSADVSSSTFFQAP